MAFICSLLNKRLNYRSCLTHTVTIVLIIETTEQFEGTILVQHADGGMSDTVEHRRFDSSVVDHVLKDEGLPYL